MPNFTRLSKALVLLVALASCNPPLLRRHQPVSIQAITPEHIKFNNGQVTAMPFAGQENVTRIFLVRHAEKAYGYDPALAFKGVRRASLLAEILKEMPLDAVYATHFKRTQETAKPAAREKGLDIQQYDPKELAALVFRLRRKNRGQSVLVVGHSDTTPEVVNRLVSRGVLERIDERDYSNFYIVAIGEKGEKEVLRLKYGEAWRE